MTAGCQCICLFLLLGTVAVNAAAKQSASKDGNPVASPAVPEAPVMPAAAQQQYADALRLLKAGQSEQASVSLQKLADAYPTFSGALLNLGLMQQKAAQHEAAVALFKRALERDAKSAMVATQLGISYRYLGKFKEAEAAYQAAIDADASYALAHFNLGILYDLYLQQAALALQEYETYQSLLTTPDAKVASWVKELKTRVANGQTTHTAAKADTKISTGSQP